MTLPAKSFSMLLIAAALCFAACDKKSEPTPEQDLYGNVTRPTWTVPETYDYSSSMTAVIKVANLNGIIVNDSIVNGSDLLAAFSGETCLGIASPQDGLFFLYIASPATGNPSSVTLRYYSAHYKNLFEAANAFIFHNDDHLGTVAQPLTPTFVVIK